MPRRHLSDHTIGRLASPGEQPREFTHKLLPGLGVKVHPSGRKVFFFRTGSGRNGERRSYETLGEYPMMKFDEALERAYRLTIARRDPTRCVFSDLIQEFLRDSTHLKSYAKICHNLTGAIHRALGHLPVSRLSRSEVMEFVNSVKQRGAPHQAEAYRKLVIRVLNWAVSVGKLESNPAQGTQPVATKKARTRYLTMGENRRLWKLWSQEGSTIAKVFQLLALTLQRSAEVRHMKWEEIHTDERGTFWLFHGKGDRENATPLAPQALDIIESLRGEDDTYVFINPSSEPPGKPFDSMIRAYRRYAKESGVPNWSTHTLRKNMTWFARRGVPLHVQQAVLNHTPRGVTSTHYQFYRYFDEAREALEWWANELTSD